MSCVFAFTLGLRTTNPRGGVVVTDCDRVPYLSMSNRALGRGTFISPKSIDLRRGIGGITGSIFESEIDQENQIRAIQAVSM